MKRLSVLIVFALFCAGVLLGAGCENNVNAPEKAVELKSYKEIQGISKDDISAVESLLSSKTSFTYGHIHGPGAFKNTDGSCAGFSVKVSEFLSELFDIEFTPVHFDSWDEMKTALDNSVIDFCDFHAFNQAAHSTFYHMTSPISSDSLRVYISKDNGSIINEADISGLKIGFLSGTEIADIITDKYPEMTFETISITTKQKAYEMLMNEEIDAFVADETEYFVYEDDCIVLNNFFKMLSIPVSLATANNDYKPIISALNQYLSSGGFYKLQEMKAESKTELTSRKLYEALTEDEKDYISGLLAGDGKVDIGIQHDVYPVTFYNKTDKEYQGVALDVLNEISRITGIVFEPKTTTTDTPLSDILAKLREGEIQMMTQLLYTESRKNDYTWSRTPYMASSYALISSRNLPNLDAYQIYYVKVGTIDRSAHEEVFNAWFPDHPNRVVYNTTDEGFDALEKGEVDLLMLAENMVLTMTHYREKPEYKVNFSFDIPLESLFGYTKSEIHLASIVDKAMTFINLNDISETWMNRAFDYSQKISNVRTNYLLVIVIASLAALAAMFFLFIRNMRLHKIYAERSAELNTILTSIPDIIFCMDLRLVYTSCNPGFEKFSGLDEKDIIGKSDLEVFKNHKKEMVDFFIEVNNKVIQTCEKIRVEEWIEYPDGRKRFFETIKTPLIQNGEISGILGIARDITEHKAAEEEARKASLEAQQASQVKSMFLANMSHEIRTPMNAIIGMAELLLNDNLSERQLQYVGDINTSSHALLAIINDILDLSKIESGKLELNPVDYDFHTVTDNINSMFKLVAEKKGLEFKYEISGEFPKVVFGDDIRLRQVLTNICGNAVKFTGQGHVKMSVIVKETKIIFVISDTGMGIKEEDIPKLFDAFSQADTSKNRNIVGTGLGLAISKSFIEMMNGNIKVESVYGQGTVFTVTIPKIIGNPDNVKHKDENEQKKRFAAPKARILVVDDNEVNLKVACGLLNLYRIEAETVLSGFEAIELIREHDYDIVFMDHMMPEMDGIETTEKIRSFGGKFVKIPIIALTANAVHGAKDMFLTRGFNGFVSKPIEVLALADALRSWLPKEKIEELAEQTEPEKSETGGSEFLDRIKNINGINLEVGLSHVSGMEQMYRETLGIFYRKLEGECKKMEETVNSGDLHNFAIIVHGIKSTLATIGSVQLSGTAFELEKASKADDGEYCMQNLPAFLENLRTLHDELSDVFTEEKSTVKKLSGDINLLNEKIEAALEATADFDNNTGLKLIEELLLFDYGDETNALLENAKDAFADFDCDKAAEYLKGISNE
ncbi:MAG: transporter substrate-binding domain-containing protein [Oscillospiraceae bacterium]|nr:transporter substrate-binding domain-containing protein [Oscillospiraceae bacterium]